LSFFTRSVFTCFLALLLGASGVAARSLKQDGAAFSVALAEAGKEQWVDAVVLADQIKDPVAGDLIEWLRLRDGVGSFADYRAFLKKHPDWPGLAYLRKRGEAAIPERYKPDVVLAYFKGHAPRTGTGSLRLTEAYLAKGEHTKAQNEAARAWQTMSMTKEERVALLNKFPKTLAKHQIARMDMLLWRGLSDQATAMTSVLPKGYDKLVAARVGLRKRVKNVERLIRAVPKALRRDPGLAYERFVWRSRKGLSDSARDLLIKRSTSKASLGQPERWARRRRAIARNEMRAGNNRRAYKIAANHFLTKGSNYADLEWLSGYIALRKLNNPKLAIRHFNRFRAAVSTPISYGRAGYWLGRAYEAEGNKKAAQKAYLFGAKSRTSFYGQLAAEKAGVGPDASLAGKVNVPDWRQAAFMKSSVIRAALLLNYAQAPKQAERFIRSMGARLDATGNQQLAEMALDLGRPSIAVRLSKQAAGMGYILPKTYFPLTGLAKLKTRLRPEVAMSIARRESELNAAIISPAGARGLMQVMPKTARKMARELGLKYSLSQLTDDWKYNATLGSAYLADQLEAFNGSYILAFAAYNAGPSRAQKWREKYGDPRHDEEDQVDWIEQIPFTETRNYVMRVLESLHVYRARMAGKTQPLRISRDLKKG